MATVERLVLIRITMTSADAYMEWIPMMPASEFNNYFIPSPAMLGQLSADGITTTQVLMLVLAVAGLSAVMISTRRRIRESKALSRPSVRDRYGVSRQQQTAKRDLEAVMLELDQLSRQIHGRIDTKLARLELLLREADDRIETLTKLRSKSDREDARSIERVPSESPDSGISRAESTDPTRESVLKLADCGRSTVEIAQAVGRTPGEVELMIALDKSQSQ